MRARDPRVLCFLDFTLDVADARLRRTGSPLAIRRKTLAVLTYLAERSGQLVTSREILDAVWEGAAVTPSVLTGSIKELRRILGDDPKAPRIIETAHRHGYRFIAPVRQESAAVAIPAQESGPPSQLVGREESLESLAGWWQRAQTGESQIVFIAGEPGIGKTALVEEFLRRNGLQAGAANGAPALYAHGQCVEQHGAGEPYLPVLEALGRLCSPPGGQKVASLMRRVAPAWWLQFPWLLDPGEAESLGRGVEPTTRHRMLHEIARFVTELESPLVWVLEDLHWSDAPTLDLISTLAQRRDPARLLLLATYRPVEVAVREHSLKAVHAGLRLRKQCRELWLGPLSEESVGAYLQARWPGIDAIGPLARSLWSYSDGNPLFLESLTDYLVDHGVVACEDERWILAGDLAAVGVPQGLRETIAAHIDQISPTDRRLLQGASVAGRSFPARLIAEVLEADPVETDVRFAMLAECRQVLRADTGAPNSDPTSGSYTFRHFLYQSVLRDRVPPARRHELHARIAATLERSATQLGESGPELAYHFEASGQVDRAADCLHKDAARALGRGAAREAAALLRHGTSLLERVPATPERLLLKIRLNLALGPALVPELGHGHPEIEAAYDRARESSEALGDPVQLLQCFAALTGVYVTQGRFERAGETSKRLDALVEAIPLPTFVFVSHLFGGGVAYHSGSLADARRRLEIAVAMGDVPLPLMNLDLRILALHYLAFSLLHQGYPEQAQARMQAAWKRAEESAIPYNRAATAQFDCGLQLLQRDHAELARAATAAVELGRANEFPAIVAVGEFAQGRWLCAEGRAGEGVAMMQEAMQAYESAGQRFMRPMLLASLAEGQLALGDLAEARATVAAAHEAVRTTGETRLGADLHRIEGDIHLAGADRKASEACYGRALDIARRQEGRWLELRATVSWARLRRTTAAARSRRAAREALAAIVAAFDEGHTTADLRAAQLLLSEMDG